MEPEETPTNPTLQELLEEYNIEGMGTPFKEWFQRAIEQECAVSYDSYADMKGKEKTCFKVGDLVKRKSSVAEGAVGVITRIDDIITNKYHGKKYLVTFQQDGNQVWLHADQLEHFGKHLPRVD